MNQSNKKNPSNGALKLKALLTRYKQTKRIQAGLLRLAELTSTVDDLTCFFNQLQKIIQRYFPADNLYIQIYCQPDDYQASHYYVDNLHHSPIDQQLNKDLVEFINSIGKPVLINGNTISILELAHTISNRPFPARSKDKQLNDIWLISPLTIEGINIGLVGIKGFVSVSNNLEIDLELIKFISTLISASLHRTCATAQLALQSADIEEVIFTRTKDLQQSNRQLREQVEARRQVEQKLYFAAHHDTLTKLPNRAMFTERLEHSLKHLKRHRTHRFAVLFIDLDRFKVINDSLGHHVGDQLLIQISERIAECIRGNDILARLGGDEFVILLDTLAHNDDAEDIALRIIESIQKPFNIGGQMLYSSASIGITICGNNYDTATDILRDADAAMYQAKAIGRGRLAFFDDSMRAELLANLTLEQDLRKATQNNEFKLSFQRIADLSQLKTVGFEALLRWHHPNRGILSPSDFLIMAEETGLIIDIEHWLLTQVQQQMRLWQEKALKSQLFISVNLSGKHLSSAKQVRLLGNKIIEIIPYPERLIIEFSENDLNQNPERTLQHLKMLKNTGVRFALDGYGSGLFSLNYLQSYPFDIIKLEQNFVRSLKNNHKNLALAKSISTLAETFNFKLVAEGLESDEHLNMAISIGCNYGQGFYIGRPSSQIVLKNDVDNCA